MQLSILALALLFQGGAPATAAALPVDHDLERYSLCIAEGVEPAGRTRYVSDPFETWDDANDARAYQEYVEQAYLHRRDSGFAAACRSYADRAEAGRALDAALKPVAGVKIVETKWRAHFE